MARSSGAPREDPSVTKNCSAQVNEALAQLSVRPLPAHLRGDATTYQLAVEVHASLHDWPACLSLFWQLHSIGARERHDKPLPTEFYVSMIEAAATCRVQLVEQVEQVMLMALKAANSTKIKPKAERNGVTASSRLLRSMMHFYLSAGALPAALHFFNAWSDAWSLPPTGFAPSPTLGQSVRSRLFQAVCYSRPTQPDPAAYPLLLQACAKAGKTSVAHGLMQIMRKSDEHVASKRRGLVLLRPEIYMHLMNAWNQRAIREFHSPPLIRKAPSQDTASTNEPSQVDELPSIEQLESDEDAALDSAPLSALGLIDLSLPCTAAEYCYMHVAALWREMITCGIPQDKGVYNAVILSATLVGRVDEVQQLIEAMETHAAAASRASTPVAPGDASQAAPSDHKSSEARISTAPSALTFAHAYIACVFESSSRSLSRAADHLTRMESFLPLSLDDGSLTKPLALARFDRLQALYIHILPLLTLKQQWFFALQIVTKLEAISDALQKRFNVVPAVDAAEPAPVATSPTDSASADPSSPASSPAAPRSDFLLSRAVYQLAMDSCDLSYQSAHCVQLFRSLFRRGVRPDASIYTTLLCGLVRCRDWSGALEVLSFLESQQSDVSLGLESWKRVQPLMARRVFQTGAAAAETAAASREGSGPGAASSGKVHCSDLLHDLSIAQDLLKSWRSNGASAPTSSGSSSAGSARSSPPMAIHAYYSPQQSFVPDLGRGQQALPALSPFLKAAYSDPSSLLAPLLQTVLPPPDVSVLQALRELVQERIDEKTQADT